MKSAILKAACMTLGLVLVQSADAPPYRTHTHHHGQSVWSDGDTPLIAVAESRSILAPVAGGSAAESVHVQPRARTFVPNNAEDDAVQRRISKFNARQAVLNAWFDRRELTVCRGC